MRAKEVTCVICPNGCSIAVEINDNSPEVICVTGHTCKKGEKWARQEEKNPMRTITSSIPVIGGDFILTSVRTTRPVPLAKIMQVMDAIKASSLNAPVKIGDVVILSAAECDTEVIVTRNVSRNNK